MNDFNYNLLAKCLIFLPSFDVCTLSFMSSSLSCSRTIVNAFCLHPVNVPLSLRS